MELKFDPGFRVIWLSISSQFDSQYRLNLTLSNSSQFDFQYRVNLTLNIESIWLSISSQFDSNILKLLEIPCRFLVPPVTQLFRSKWLHFFFQWSGCKKLNEPPPDIEGMFQRLISYSLIKEYFFRQILA